MTAGPLPTGVVLEPMAVQALLAPPEVKVEVSGSLLILPQQAEEGQRIVKQFAERVRRDFEARFLADAQAAGLPLRGSTQPGMTLTIRASQASASYVMPGAPGYSSKSPNPFVQLRYQGTLTDAAGKELWWFKASLFTSPTLEALPPERQLQNGYRYLMFQMLKALRTDGLLPEQKAAPQ